MVNWTERRSVDKSLLSVDPRIENRIEVYIDEDNSCLRIPDIDRFYQEGKLIRSLSPEIITHLIKNSWLRGALWPFLIGKTNMGSPYKEKEESEREKELGIWSEFSDPNPFLSQVYSDPIKREESLRRAEQILYNNILDIIEGNIHNDILVVGRLRTIIDFSREKKQDKERNQGRKISLFTLRKDHIAITVGTLSEILYTIYNMEYSLFFPGSIEEETILPEERLPRWEGTSRCQLTPESIIKHTSRTSVPSLNLISLLKTSGVLYGDYYCLVRDRLYLFGQKGVLSYDEEDSRLIIEELAYRENAPVDKEYYDAWSYIELIEREKEEAIRRHDGIMENYSQDW